MAALGTALVLLLGLIASMDSGKSREPQVTVHCEGEYRVFMRGEQIEVLYDPDCMKVAKA